MPLEPRWSQRALEDYAYWQENSPNTVIRIDALLASSLIDPDRGIGKPERLKYKSHTIWSRRVTRGDRFVYTIRSGELWVLQCRFHYDK